MHSPDVLFQTQQGGHDFVFDEKVVAVFDDMVSRSVPMYDELQHMLADLTQQFLPEVEGCVIDLGCSTGTTLERILAHPACRTGTRAIGIDNAPAMIAQASTRLQSYVSAGRASFSTADLNSEFELPPANVVLMNWTLQFVRPIHRETVLHRVHDCLKPGGALLLSEKVLVEDSLLNRLYIELYYRFKGRQGYTTEEIQRKRESLENVLVPYRVEENLELLHRCGFPSVDMFFRWYNWAGIVAHKV